jgi:HSP20 family protein
MAPPARRHRPSPDWSDPLTEFADLYDRMGELFTWAFSDRARARPPAWLPAWSPATDLSETDDAYIVDVDLPGLRREDVTIEIHGEDLVITGEFKDPGRRGTIRRRARPMGHFECRTTLPGPFKADKVSARLTDGVLTVTLPKTDAGKPRQVQISAD